MKLQALTFPNGMFGSVYIGPMRVSDNESMNMSDLDTYHSQSFFKFSRHICSARNQFSTVYGDGIFPQLLTVIARYSAPDENEGRTNTCLTSV